MPEPEDYEAPTLLSDSQLEAKTDAVVAALTKMGVQARVTERCTGDFHRVKVDDPINYHCATLDLDAEGGATWDIWGETPADQHTSAQEIISAIHDRLRAPTPLAPTG